MTFLLVNLNSFDSAISTRHNTSNLIFRNALSSLVALRQSGQIIRPQSDWVQLVMDPEDCFLLT